MSRDNYYISADAYSDVLMFPFENIMVPVPVGYDEILRVKYGDNYMIPVNNGGGHGYPYYNVFVRKLFNLDEEADLNEAREYVKKWPAIIIESLFHKAICQRFRLMSHTIKTQM